MNKKNLKIHLYELKWKIHTFIENYILRKEYCDYCYYFGGLICDHIDENGECLGFRRYTLKDKIRYKRTQRKYDKWAEAHREELRQILGR